jgi:uncharacterized metal-binding protein YceD (DUF177 family)
MAKRKSSPDGFGWSYLIDQGEIGAAQPYHKKLAATEAECKAIAERLNIPAIQSLSAEMTLSRVLGNKAVVYVDGTLKANVIQSCVVTGVPVKSYVEEEFEAWYADPTSFTSLTKARHEKTAKATETEIPVLEEHEDPESMTDGKIDLGDLVTQYLSLGLDPYPKAHGAAWEEGEKKDVLPSELRKNPFEVLKDWKK